MAKVRIIRKNGAPTPYFWSDRGEGDHTHETIYKQTESGVKRMKGVYFNAVTKRVHKEG